MPPPAAPRVALVLSGAGVHDGTEIHEATLIALALDRAGATVLYAAPNVAQTVVIDHFTGEPNRFETRNVLVESARIARGAVRDLATVGTRDLDAAVFPGGYGVTKNLSDQSIRGRDARVLPDVDRFVREMHAARKPLGFVCTAPLLAARVLGPTAHPEVTLGHDVALALDVVAWGARHRDCDARSIVVDRDQRIVSTPAYMVSTRLRDIAEGIDRAMRALLELLH